MTSNKEPPLRKELVEARENIIEQLDQLRPVNRSAMTLLIAPPDNRTIIAELEGQLREIEGILASKEPPDA